jgi:maltokinase
VIDADRWTELLVEGLPAHLAQQRWSGAHDRAIAAVTVEWLDVLASEEPLLAWALVEARFADGGTQRYQVFIGGRASHPRPDFLEGKDHQQLAEVSVDGHELVLYDALIDPDLAIAVLHLVLPDAEVVVRRPIVLEHSNSSIIFDEATILKVFRKVDPGPNPDVQITRVLAAQGYPNVLPPLAELRRDGTDLAVVRTYLVEATEGWDLARTSVRDVLASRLPPEESGGDFAPESTRLGATIASLHVAMAAAWGATPGDPEAWARDMEAHLDGLVQGAASGLDRAQLDPEVVRGPFRAAAAVSDGGREILVHGDLHLAQVMKVDPGWIVLDFEGEPARRRADRFARSSPLRDVAGILRSFHYAAATGLAEWDLGDDELVELLAAWEERNRAAFLEGYLTADGIDALLPADPTSRARLLAAFELDKAVYELGYELGHRPDKVSIPLAGIERLVRGPVAT